jgi:hypothetical protein
MVIRNKIDRRRRQVRQSICKSCLSLLTAVALVVGPLIWERIVSIADLLMNVPSTWRN